jgi:hypothetical protein
MYTTIFNLGEMIEANATATTSSTPTPTISTDGRCGADQGDQICLGSTYGDCCSIYGWCGSEPANCGYMVCDTEYGTCDPVPETPPISQDGTCGLSSFIGATCAGSGFGNPQFGTCGATPPPVSTDGLCGTNGHTCAGYSGGGCCSTYGYCGATVEFCGTGCQAGFGTCDTPVSTDGTCSSNSDPAGATCAGSGFGGCCSEYGYCGDTNAYCGLGCQSVFGTCT